MSRMRGQSQRCIRIRAVCTGRYKGVSDRSRVRSFAGTSPSADGHGSLYRNRQAA